MLRFVLALTAFLLMLPAAGPLRAAEAASGFATAVAALNGDGFDDKIAAVETLGELADARAVPVLQALADGRLFALADGRLVYRAAAGSGESAYLDAVSGQPAGGLSADDLSEITLNNRVRGVLEGVLGRFALSGPDPAARLRAAQAMVGQHDARVVPLLQRALEQETDTSVRQALTAALAGFQLDDPNPAVRLRAVGAIAEAAGLDARRQLDSVLAGEKDPQVRQAASKALSSIDLRLALADLGANLFQGVSLGSVLLLAAIGLAITFGVMGVVNMAHGEMIMLGAYTTFAVQQAFRAWLPAAWGSAYPLVSLPVAFLLTALVGVGLERLVIRFLYGRPLETLLATWGISLALQQAVRSIFGPDNQAVANPGWMTGGLALSGGFILTWNRVAIIVFCLAVVAALAFLLRASAFGLQMRAVAQNRQMAAAMGIRTGRVDALTFGLGSGIAGMAGVALSQIGNVSPNLGQIYIVDSFMVVVFGGVGSLWGTFLGAMSLGVVNKLLEPFAGAILGKIAVLVFIILFIQRRPRGLFALKGRSVEG